MSNYEKFYSKKVFKPIATGLGALLFTATILAGCETLPQRCRQTTYQQRCGSNYGPDDTEHNGGDDQSGVSGGQSGGTSANGGVSGGQSGGTSAK